MHTIILVWTFGQLAKFRKKNPYVCSTRQIVSKTATTTSILHAILHLTPGLQALFYLTFSLQTILRLTPGLQDILPVPSSLQEVILVAGVLCSTSSGGNTSQNVPVR